MNDFNNNGVINVTGDVVIGDGNNSGKLLIQCTNEELVREREFRKENKRREFKTKSLRVCCCATFFLLVTWALAGYQFFSGNEKLSFLVLGFGSLGMAYLGVQTVFTPNSFEEFEQAHIEEIDLILRSRRVNL